MFLGLECDDDIGGVVFFVVAVRWFARGGVRRKASRTN